MTPIERFENLYVPVTETGCWLWEGYCNAKTGYSQFWYKGTTWPGHRVAWELYRGPIPEGLTIDHLCRIRCCVNPDHLEPVTQKENTLRGIGPTSINAKKTHCINGHELVGRNLIIRKDGKGRDCRKCLNNNATRFRNRRKAL